MAGGASPLQVPQGLSGLGTGPSVGLGGLSSLGAAASPLSFAQTGISAFSHLDQGITGSEQQIQSGTQTSEMDQFQAQRLADASDFATAQAAQTDSVMRQQLQRAISTATAAMGSANVAPDSPSGGAILARTQGQGDQEREISVSNLYQQAQEDQSESGFYTTAAQQTLQDAYNNAGNSMLSGILGGVGSLLGNISGFKVI